MERYVFLHGLGQTSTSWNETLSHTEVADGAKCPDLFSFLKRGDATYETLYRGFSQYCGGLSGQLDLCGLSLGAVLALNYGVDHPERVRSLVLIAPQYKMPKALLKLQNVIFRFMPNQPFYEMGITKQAFIKLTNSMLDLDLADRLGNLSCPVLVLCGERDKANRSAAEKLIKEVQNGNLWLIKGAGHEVNMETPEKLAQVLKRFYNSVKDKSAQKES